MKILLVDDEPLVLAGIARMLRAEDCVTAVVTAEDGFAALELLKRYRPDLVVTDIRMPELDGLQLIQKVRETQLCKHFIIISSYADFSYAQQAITLGVKNYLLNPVDRKELHRAIESIAREIRDERDIAASESGLTREQQFHRRTQAILEAQRQSNGPDVQSLLRLTGLAAEFPTLAPTLLPILQGERFSAGTGDPLYESALYVLKNICSSAGLSPNAQSILRYLLDHYHQPGTTLQSLGKATNLHPNYASGIVSRELGTQFVKYLNVLRVILAERLLLSGEHLTTQAVAHQSGFENANHFFRVFKHYTRKTPGEFRKTKGEYA